MTTTTEGPSTAELDAMAAECQSAIAAYEQEVNAVRVAALKDPKKSERRKELGRLIHDQQDILADVAAARPQAEEREREAAERELAERRKDVYAATVAKRGELVDLSDEEDSLVEQLRTIRTRKRTVAAALYSEITAAMDRDDHDGRERLMMATLNAESPSAEALDGTPPSDVGRRMRAQTEGAEYAIKRALRLVAEPQEVRVVQMIGGHERPSSPPPGGTLPPERETVLYDDPRN